jgi:glucan phosphoethanolaminetransferase (alkaline phosphatase superfamily)
LKQAIFVFLIATEFIIFFLAILVILRSKLPLFDSFAWFLLSIFFPILGPFLTIAFLPKNKNIQESNQRQQTSTNKQH